MSCRSALMVASDWLVLLIQDAVFGLFFSLAFAALTFELLFNCFCFGCCTIWSRMRVIPGVI